MRHKLLTRFEAVDGTLQRVGRSRGAIRRGKGVHGCLRLRHVVFANVLEGPLVSWFDNSIDVLFIVDEFFE